MSEPKTDIEVNNLASVVLRDLTEEFSEAVYSPISGKLTSTWSTKKGFNAEAFSKKHPSAGPEHTIVIDYTIATELYRYAEKLSKFTRSEKLKKFLETQPNDYMPLPLIPKSTPGDSFVNNIFLAALTWIFFHELGHAAQDHGLIREKNLDTESSTSTSVNDEQPYNEEYSYTQEAHSQTDKKLSHHNSLIYHVTELAADSEATCTTIFEILKHAATVENLDALGKLPKLNWKFILDNCYLMIAGISCIFFRFNNDRATPTQASATGTHPNAFFRMEMVVRQICRQLKFIAKEAEHKISDREILRLAKQAADLSALFWHHEISDQTISEEDLLIRGLAERPEFKSYTAELITTWDNLIPQIFEARRFGSRLGILHFDKEHREYIFGKDHTQS